MAYENVNVFKLESALNKIDNISYGNIDNLYNKLATDQWQSPIRNRIRTALKEVVSEYMAIQKEIRNYKLAASLIRNYQQSDDDYKKYVKKTSDAKQKYDKYRYKTNPDSSDEYWKNYYKNKYNEYLSKQKTSINNKNEMKRRIDSLIN